VGRIPQPAATINMFFIGGYCVKRRTLDIIFSGGGVLFAVLLLVLGFVLRDQYDFAKDYVKTELGAQRITFAAAADLKPDETSWKPGSKCLTDNAGKQMETGKQAECYASYYIALHMRNAAKDAYPAGTYDDDTYATMGGKRTALQTAYDAALKDKGATDAATVEAKKKLDAATALRGTFQTGETLRGLLLTTYGFSIFGDKAGLAATICFILAALLVVLSLAGFFHAFRTPPDTVVLGGK
jgi:hypothetical protein